VVVSAARNYAVFSEEFLIVESRQIGIVSVEGNRQLLKALELYLSSDFAYYHQFLTTIELGVKRDRATLESLRQIPLPLFNLTLDELGSGKHSTTNSHERSRACFLIRSNLMLTLTNRLRLRRMQKSQI
jgi:hypothetical protein